MTDSSSYCWVASRKLTERTRICSLHERAYRSSARQKITLSANIGSYSQRLGGCERTPILRAVSSNPFQPDYQKERRLAAKCASATPKGEVTANESSSHHATTISFSWHFALYTSSSMPIASPGLDGTVM